MRSPENCVGYERTERFASPGGRVEARKRGAKFGRKPKLSEHQQAEAKQRLAKGETCRSIGRSFNVHHATISRLG